MDGCVVIRLRLEELGQEQQDLAVAAEITRATQLVPHRINKGQICPVITVSVIR